MGDGRDDVPRPVRPHAGGELRDASEGHREQPDHAKIAPMADPAGLDERDHRGRDREAREPECGRSRDRLEKHARTRKAVAPRSVVESNAG